MFQLMSIFPTEAITEAYSDRFLAFLCSSQTFFSEGISVRVTAPGNTTRFAITIRFF
jgi:hypothetical protein